MADDGGAVQNPGWNEDIQGMLSPFTSQMMWRLDLGSYEDVRANATIILGRISNGGGMPPPPFPPLTSDQITTFGNWVGNDCPLSRPPAPASSPTLVAGNQQTKRAIKFP